MMWLWLLLFGGGALAYEATSSSSASSLPSGLTPAMVASAVKNALATETDPSNLNAFALTLAPYNNTLAGQLRARALVLAPTPAITKPTITAQLAPTQAQRPQMKAGV